MEADSHDCVDDFHRLVTTVRLCNFHALNYHQSDAGITTMVEKYLINAFPTPSNSNTDQIPSNSCKRKHSPISNSVEQPPVQRRRVGRPLLDKPSQGTLNTRNTRKRQNILAELDRESLEHGAPVVQWVCYQEMTFPTDYLGAYARFCKRFNLQSITSLKFGGSLPEKPSRGPKPQKPPTPEERKQREQQRPGMVHCFLKQCLNALKQTNFNDYDSFMSSIENSAPKLFDSLVID